MSASMADLLSNADDASSPAFQDKIKGLVANFDKHFTSPIDAWAPAFRSVRIEVPAQVVSIDNTATSDSTPFHQVTSV